jgi:hypothetical protein
MVLRKDVSEELVWKRVGVALIIVSTPVLKYENLGYW